MKEKGDIFQAIEGIDTEGKVKAISCLMIEKRFGNTGAVREVQKLVYTRDAIVRIRMTSDFAVVDLGFDGYADYDYRQALELCQEFAAMTDACECGAEPDSEPSLLLSVSPKVECEFSLMGRDAAWGFLPEKPEGICNTIRLIFAREKFGLESKRRQ